MVTPLNSDNFDPTSVGAVPITPSPATSAARPLATSTAFDPASIGAVPVKSTFSDSNSQIGGGTDWNSVGHWLENSADSIEQPFISLAATPVQLLAKALGHEDPYASGMPGLPGTGNIPIASATTGKGLLEKAGQLGQVGTLALTPESMGVTGGLAGIAKMALLGGAGGAANAAANGASLDLNPFAQGEMPEAMRQGALFSGILGGLGTAAGWIGQGEKALTGIDPGMQTEFGRLKTSTLGNMINIAKKSATDPEGQTLDDHIVNDITKGNNILQQKIIPKAKQALNTAMDAEGSNPVVYSNPTGGSPVTGTDAVHALTDDANDAMQRMTGHQFADYATPTDLPITNYPEGASTRGISLGDPTVQPLPGRPGAALEPAAQKKLEWVGQKLQILSENPTVQTASDIMHQMDGKIDWTKPAEDPADGFMRYVRGSINRVVQPAAPALAAANERYSTLMDTANAVQGAAGKDLSHVDLLARRTVYAGQSGKAQTVLGNLFDEVKPYLPAGEESYTTKAIAGKFIGKTFGGTNSQTGLGQSFSNSDAGAIASGMTRSLVTAATKIARRVLAPDTEQYALSIAKGEPYSFVPLMHHIDSYLDTPSAQPWLQSFKTGLQKMGVTSANAGQAAKDALRMMMFNNLMNTAGQNAAAHNRNLTP